MNTRCRTCQRDRLPGALYCGTCLEVRFFGSEPRQTPEWIRRAEANRLPAKDMTRAA